MLRLLDNKVQQALLTAAANAKSVYIEPIAHISHWNLSVLFAASVMICLKFRTFTVPATTKAQMNVCELK